MIWYARKLISQFVRQPIIQNINVKESVKLILDPEKLHWCVYNVSFGHTFSNFSVNGFIPVSFFIYQTSKLFQSLDQEYQLGKSRRRAVGTRIISATVEGARVKDLPNGQEIKTAFYELNVRPLNQTKASQRQCCSTQFECNSKLLYCSSLVPDDGEHAL